MPKKVTHYPNDWFNQPLASLPNTLNGMKILNDLTTLYSGKLVGHWVLSARNEIPFDYGRYKLSSTQ